MLSSAQRGCFLEGRKHLVTIALSAAEMESKIAPCHSAKRVRMGDC